jgi:hypothetical protein
MTLANFRRLSPTFAVGVTTTTAAKPLKGWRQSVVGPSWRNSRRTVSTRLRVELCALICPTLGAAAIAALVSRGDLVRVAQRESPSAARRHSTRGSEYATTGRHRRRDRTRALSARAIGQKIMPYPPGQPGPRFTRSGVLDYRETGVPFTGSSGRSDGERQPIARRSPATWVADHAAQSGDFGSEGDRQ